MQIIPDHLKEAIRRLVAEQIACCCAGGNFDTTTLSPPVDAPGEGDPTVLFNTETGVLYYYFGGTWNSFTSGSGGGVMGVTELSPPVAAPVGDDPTVLINLTTGVIYYWNGSAWLVANDGGTDTNVANTDLTFLANRLHDLGNFTLIFTGDGPATGFGFNANDTGNGRSTSVNIAPTLLTLQMLSGLNTSQLLLGGTYVRIDSSLGVYELETTPVTDETATISLGYNTVTNRIVAMTKYTVSDIAYAASWDGVTTVAPSKNAVYDEMQLRALDSAVVHNTGNENVGGVKTFTSDPLIPDEAYSASWDGVLEPPTKNAVYDQMELKANITALANLKLDQFGITIDGGGSVLSTGTKGYISVPYSGTITGWTILEISATPTPSSSIVVDIWKDTYANYPPTVADAIFTTKPTITTGIKGQNLAPTFVGAGATVTAGDIIGFNVDSVTNAVKVTVLLHITKT